MLDLSSCKREDGYQFAIEPSDAEYVNVTEFLTDENAVESLRFEAVEDFVEDLVLFSDGVEKVAVDSKTKEPYKPFLVPMMAPIRRSEDVNGLNEKLENFLSSDAINEKTDDDKTIILASRADPERETKPD